LVGVELNLHHFALLLPPPCVAGVSPFKLKMSEKKKEKKRLKEWLEQRKKER